MKTSPTVARYLLSFFVASAAYVWIGSPALRAQASATAKTYECTTRLEIAHLDVVAAAKPVPVEVAAEAHAGMIANWQMVSKVLPLQSADEREEPTVAERNRRRRALCDRFAVTAKPSAKAGNITEVELRYRADNPADCVRVTKSIVVAYQELLNSLQPIEEKYRASEEKAIEQMALEYSKMEKSIESFRRMGDVDAEADLRLILRYSKAFAAFSRLKMRVGKFVVTVTEPALQAVELKSP